MTLVLKVADFSLKPMGRNATHDKKANGYKFRREILMPALEDNESVLVDFGPITVAGPSFLDEVFGGLVFDEEWSAQDVRRRVRVSFPADRTRERFIWSCVDDAQRKMDLKRATRHEAAHPA